MKHHRSLKKQQGVVIIVALFIVALVAGMAYVMMARLTRDTERTTLIVQDAVAENQAEGSVLWAISLLKKNWDEKKPNQLVDHLPITAPPMTIDQYKIETTIDDMQARFNINNLSDPKAQADFVQLARSADKNITPDNAIALGKAITEWILPMASQADQYYLKLPEPYRPAHRFMQSTSELQLVKGMTPSLYHALQPYVVALPVATQINVQTADAPVLTTLGPSMTLDAAKSIITARTQKPFATPDDLTKLDIAKNHNLDSTKMTTISNYFLVTTTVSIDDQQVVIYNLLERTAGNGKATINRLWQSKGIW